MSTPQDIQNQQALNNELGETQELVLEIKNAFRGIGAEINELIKDKMKNLNGSAKTVARTIKEDVVKNLQSQAKETAKINSLYNKQINGSLKVAEVEAKVSKSRELHVQLMESLEEALREGVITQETFNGKVEAATKEFEKQQEKLRQMRERAAEFERKLGLSYKIFKGIAEIPIIGKLIDVEKVTEAMETSVGKGASAWKAFGSGIGATFKSIGKSLKDPLVILGIQIALFKKIFDLNKEINQRQVEQQRALGISADQSQRLAQSTFEYANATNDVFVTEKRLTEGRTKLNQLLGTSVVYTNQSVEGFERLTHYYGVSEESAASLTELATAQGISTKDILNSTIRTANEQKRQFGGTISYQKVLQKVSSTGGDILTKFKGNTDALAKAVMQADRLGLSLEQVNKTGESLLDFEQSIEAELKAELLTGKAINLERARAAALSGDLATLTTEIANQTGGIAQFQKMNAIQQKAYAEAFGMTTAEMGDMLRKREFEAKLGADAKKSAEEQLKIAEKRGIKIEDSVRKELEAKTLADKQKYVFEKLAEVLGRLTSGPMQKFMDMLSSALGFVEKIFSFFGKMTGGVVGDALGSVLLGAPLLIGGIRMLAGGIKSMLLGSRGSTPLNPMYVSDIAGGGAGGGLTDMVSGGFGGKRSLVKRFGAKGARNLIKGVKGFGIGAAIGIGADLVAGQMEEGGAKDTVEGIGTTASWAGTGALIGSVIPGVGTAVGAVVGGLAGAMTSLFTAEENRIKREEARKKVEEDQKNRTNELLEQLALRPNVLNVGGKTIMEFNTAADQYGTRGSSFN